MIQVAIGDDHNSLIDGLKSYLENQKDIRMIGSANNGRDLLDLVSRKQPDVVITDIRMPVKDGITVTKEIVKIYPHIKVIAFTMFDQDDAVQQMLRAGAKGYLLKNSGLGELLLAIRTVFNGHQYFDPNIITPDINDPIIAKGILSKRQLEILKLVGLGKTNQEIADQLFIGKFTVETHRKNIIRILNLKGAGELLRYAIESKYHF